MHPFEQLPASELWQVPAALHAWLPEQLLHAMPPVPQLLLEVDPEPGFRHVPLESQQPVQLLVPQAAFVTHAPCWQACPLLHAWQLIAPTPHAVA